ncbi:hypothetical protein AK830_g1995 [Neonectria ditissima]|uniref:N-acetyltransferase domain-containing protein n=1 Tax=Neonectria ditissima TaxID=78410 RepID=A0A0P7BGV2_9HYPO|nr:hypothetical protein AK830_g1995 [Neonectria ditissima]
MDYTTTEIVDAFQSARLRYIRADDSDEALKNFVPQIVQDPLIQAMASPSMLQPTGKKDLDSYLRSVTCSLLGVAICLSPEEDSRINPPEDANGDTAPNTKPTIIGIMCIGWGGVSSMDRHHRNSDIGISLAKPYQDKGYGREAINWMLDWAFRHAGLHTVGITTASYNPKAVHLYEDIGFKLEGRRRETIWQNRQWHDLLEFGVTEGEWEKLRGLSTLAS